MNCPHRWRIAEPDGRPELPGVCQLCGATRTDFKAASDSTPWAEIMKADAPWKELIYA